MQEALVTVHRVSKRFCTNIRAGLRYAVADIAGAVIGVAPRRDLRPHEFWALRDVSLSVAPGRCTGIVGRNGAGKSTLIRLIAGKLAPNGGTITKRGNVGLLLDAEALLNPVESGRETILSFGAMHGLSPAEARRATDAIADFAELGSFIDAPVGTYSAGMRARLSYAAVTHFAPGVLVIDEMLAVGDIGFRRKCVHHLRRYLDRGGALIVVSHDVYPLQYLADRMLLLDRGVVLAEGEPRAVLQRYFALLSEDEVHATVVAEQGGPPQPVVIDSMSIEAADGGALRTGCHALVTLSYDALAAMDVSWGFNIATADQTVSVTSGTGGFTGPPFHLPRGRGELTARIPRLSLAPGAFVLRGAIVDYVTRAPIADMGWQQPGTLFTVAASAAQVDNLHSIVGDLVTMEAEFDACSAFAEVRA